MCVRDWPAREGQAYTVVLMANCARMYVRQTVLWHSLEKQIDGA